MFCLALPWAENPSLWFRRGQGDRGSEGQDEEMTGKGKREKRRARIEGGAGGMVGDASFTPT